MWVRAEKNLRVRVAAIVVVLAGTVFAIDDGGQHRADAGPPPANSSVFTPIAPQRLVDTRNGTGALLQRLQGSTTMDVPVTGRLGIPASATAVMANVTAVDSAGAGYVQVLPTGRATIGSASTLNVDSAGQTIPNAAFAPLGDGGKLTVFSTFTTDIVIDISGYFTPASSSTSGRLVPVTPNRILDTRIGLGWTPPAPPPTTNPGTIPTTVPTTPVPTTPAPTTPVPTTVPTTTVPGPPANPGDTKNCGDFANYQQAKAWFDTYYPYYGDIARLDGDNNGKPCESLPGAPNTYSPRPEVVAPATIIRLQVAGRGGVPTAGVSAVVINVTAVDPTGPGYVQVAPTPVTVGASSNLNTATGRTIANLVVVPLGTGGAVDLYTTTTVDLVADVAGYFTDASAANSTAGLFVPVTPSRQLDSREPGPRNPLPAGTTTGIDVNDISSDAIAVAGNLTATEAARGWVQLAAAPVPVGASSNLNVAYDRQTIANAVVSPVAGGLLEVHNSAPAHVLLDVTGWFTGGQPPGSLAATTVLASLTIVPEYAGPLAYDRDQFPHWITGANGCDTRAQVLIRDSTTPPRLDPSGCGIVTGSWYSRYDAATWTNPGDVDIDHVVALSEAWDSGAYAWDVQQRTSYANDLADVRTLIAVTDNVNASKSDRDPTNWLPPNSGDTCRYIGDWISIKARWTLTVDTGEAATLRNLLTGSCAGLTIAPWTTP